MKSRIFYLGYGIDRHYVGAFFIEFSYAQMTREGFRSITDGVYESPTRLTIAGKKRA